MLHHAGRRTAAAALVLIAGLAGAPTATADDTGLDTGVLHEHVTVTTTDLGVSGPFVNVSDISDRGVVVGTFQAADGFHAFRWADGETTVLPGLGGRQTVATAVNERGQVVGASNDTEGRSHAVLWEADGTLVDLDPAGQSSRAADINRAGVVVGTATGPGGGLHTVVWHGGEMTPVGDLGGGFSLPVALTDLGVVVANGGDEQRIERAFRWRRGALEELPPVPSVPDHASSQATAANSRGDVVGLTEEGPSFLWTRTGVTTLPDLGGGFLAPRAINDRRQVVGLAATGAGELHAFLAQGDTVVDLGTLGGSRSEAVAINAKGQAVGSSSVQPGSSRIHAVLWDDGEIVDLGTLGGSLSAAQDINRHGQIVGRSTDADGLQHAVLWTVQPGSD